MPIFTQRLSLKTPGVFITGTDTEVGKTLTACAIAWQLRRQASAPMRVGVCKPIATGCRREREGLVSGDAEALAHFADCREPLDVINPVRYVKPVAPAVAAAQTNNPVDFDAIARSLARLDRVSDAMIVEGVGGIMVPLDETRTVLDLAASLPYPVIVVARAGLGTLNHTAMTVRLLRDAGCRIAGLIVNGYEPDAGSEDDPSMESNRQWLEAMNRTRILATIPRVEPQAVRPQSGRIDAPILNAMGQTAWSTVLD